MLDKLTAEENKKPKETPQEPVLNKISRSKLSNFMRALVMCGLLTGPAAGTAGCDTEKERVEYVSKEKEDGEGGVDWDDETSSYSYDSEKGNLQLDLDYDGYVDGWEMEAAVWAVGEWVENRGEAKGTIEEPRIETDIYVGKTDGIVSWVKITVKSLGNEVKEDITQKAFLQINEDGTVIFIGTTWPGVQKLQQREEEASTEEETTPEEEDCPCPCDDDTSSSDGGNQE